MTVTTRKTVRAGSFGLGTDAALTQATISVAPTARHLTYTTILLISIGVEAGLVGTVLTGPLFFTKIIVIIHKTDNNNY